MWKEPPHRRPNTRGMAAKVVGLVLIGVMAVALLWSASEQHYRGCVEARMARGLTNGDVTTSLTTPKPSLFNDGKEPKSITYEPAGISLRGCSRLPF